MQRWLTAAAAAGLVLGALAGTSAKAQLLISGND